MIVNNADFVGKFELAINQYSTDKIDAYIERYEPYYLTMLLGKELKDLFISDLDVNNVPQTAIYQTIYEALSIDLDNQVIFSYGIKEMLLGFIYYHYCKDETIKQTPVGSVKPNTENSINVGTIHYLTNRYNESVESLNAIQTYILENESDYSTFNGQKVKFEYFF